MGKYNINYCKTNKVAIFVQNEEQIKELEKLAKPKSKENWKRYFDNNKNWYIILSDNYNYDFSIQGELWMKIDEYEKITFNTFIEDNMEIIPEKWYVRVTEENVDILTKWKQEVSKGHFYLTANGYTGITYRGEGIYNTDKYTEITFEQFKEKIINMNTEKKEIVAYELLKDLPCLKAGAKFTYNNEEQTWDDVILGEDCYSFTQEDIDKSKDFFKAVYEKEYKVDDWVIGWFNTGSHNYHKKACQIGKVDEKFVYVKGTSNYCGINDIRKATKEEIQASQQKVITVNNTEIVIKKGSMFAVDKEFSLEYIQGILNDMLYAKGTTTWNYTFTEVKIGCREGFNKSHLELIVYNYKEFNK